MTNPILSPHNPPRDPSPPSYANKATGDAEIGSTLSNGDVFYAVAEDAWYKIEAGVSVEISGSGSGIPTYATVPDMQADIDNSTLVEGDVAYVTAEASNYFVENGTAYPIADALVEVASLPVSASEGDLAVDRATQILYRWTSGAWERAPSYATVAAMQAAADAGDITVGEVGYVTAEDANYFVEENGTVHLLENAVAEVTAFADLPSPADEGDFAYDSQTLNFYRYTGGSWELVNAIYDVDSGEYTYVEDIKMTRPSPGIHQQLYQETGTQLMLVADNGTIQDLSGNVVAGDWDVNPTAVSYSYDGSYWIEGAANTNHVSELILQSDLTYRVKFKVGSDVDGWGPVVFTGPNETAGDNIHWGFFWTAANEITWYHEEGGGSNWNAAFTLPDSMTEGMYVYLMLRRTDQGDGTGDVECWAQTNLSSWQQLTLASTNGTDNLDNTANIPNPNGGTTADLVINGFHPDNATASAKELDTSIDFCHVLSSTKTDAREAEVAAMVMGSTPSLTRVDRLAAENDLGRTAEFAIRANPPYIREAGALSDLSNGQTLTLLDRGNIGAYVDMVSSPTWNASEQTFTFDGAANHLIVQPQGPLDFVHDEGVFTIAARLKFNVNPTTNTMVILQNAGSNGPGFFWVTNSGSGDDIRLGIKDNLNNAVADCALATWSGANTVDYFNFVITSDGTTMRMYIDGTLVSSSAFVTGGTGTGFNDMYVGRAPNLATNFLDAEVKAFYITDEVKDVTTVNNWLTNGPQSSKAVVDYDTLTELYDARDAGNLTEGGVYRIQWTGDDYVADGQIITQWDGTKFDPHPLTQVEVPPQVLGQDAFSTASGTGTITFDSQDRPTISNGAAGLTGYTVDIDPRMAITVESNMAVTFRVHTLTSPVANDVRYHTYLTDVVNGHYVAAYMKYFSGWISLHAKDDGTYGEDWASSVYDADWEGFYRLSLERRKDNESFTSYASWRVTDAGNEPASRNQSGEFLEADECKLQIRATHNSTIGGSSLQLRGISIMQEDPNVDGP